RLDGVQDSRAHAGARLRERPGSGLGAAEELADIHPMAVGKQVHVAGLRGIELVPARGLERGRHLLGQFGQTAAPRRALCSSAAITSPGSTAAMRTGATFCRPDHAGMLLISSTVGRPSAPCTRSTPAKLAPTAAAARIARSFISASTTAAAGCPPCLTLV